MLRKNIVVIMPVNKIFSYEEKIKKTNIAKFFHGISKQELFFIMCKTHQADITT